MSETRKIAAILVADVVGYSRLAGTDEDRTLARLRGAPQRSDRPHHRRASRPHRQAHRRRQHHRVPQRGRRGALRDRGAERAWSSATRASRPTTRIEFRIGIHLGDVVEESDGDLMGDGVNIAARLEGICEPGGDLPVRGRLPASQGAARTSRSPISARRPSRTSPSRCAPTLLRQGAPTTQKPRASRDQASAAPRQRWPALAAALALALLAAGGLRLACGLRAALLARFRWTTSSPTRRGSPSSCCRSRT